MFGAASDRQRGSSTLGMLGVVVISGTLIAGGEMVLDTKYDYALVEATSALRASYAEARARSAQASTPVRLRIDGAQGRVTVRFESLDAGARELIDFVVGPDVRLVSDVDTMCFDGRGRPQLAEGCEEHVGSIALISRRGETWLTLRPDGQLLKSGSTVR